MCVWYGQFYYFVCVIRTVMRLCATDIFDDVIVFGIWCVVTTLYMFLCVYLGLVTTLVVKIGLKMGLYTTFEFLECIR